MSSQYFLLNINDVVKNSNSPLAEAKPSVSREKVMSYEEKSVGRTQFFKCEACPYMAFAEDDIKFHLFTEHPELAKTNGLADNITINCPGCTSTFNAEETLRTHLRNHHKMGIKDVKKMVKSLVQIVLKNAKLKREKTIGDPPPNPTPPVNDVKIPQVIQIAPDIPTSKSETLPNGVVFITVDELQKMRPPNFEQVDPKEIIQEASLNIVYSNEPATQYVSEASTSSTGCNIIQVPNVTPDLISSTQPKASTNITGHPPIFTPSSHSLTTVSTRLKMTSDYSQNNKEDDSNKISKSCNYGGVCPVRMVDDEKLSYHRRCHQNGNFNCQECPAVYVTVEMLHTHLWKVHGLDMELPTCEVCGYKTYLKHRLYNIHMKCHNKKRCFRCSQCEKTFKTTSQLSKHILLHDKPTIPLECSVCKREFDSARKLKTHIIEMHDKSRLFKCMQCKYTSVRKQELERHLRSHTGEKPYSCDTCNYHCSDHNSLRRHKKQHTKEANYQCKYCPFSAIQSTAFSCHMLSKHPDVPLKEVHTCPYCPFRTINEKKYLAHLTTHSDKESVQLLLEMSSNKTVKPSWTIPSETEIPKSADVQQNKEDCSTPQSNQVPIEVYDCDSQLDGLNNPQHNKDAEATDYIDQVQDLSKQDDNNSDCVISESSNDTLIVERQQFTTQLHMQNIVYQNSQQPIRLVKPTDSLRQIHLQSSNSTHHVLMPSHSPTDNQINNNIMSNFPIRLPPVHQSLMNNITLKPFDKMPFLMNKVTGPIIKPSQILPVPSSSNSPVNSSLEQEGAPRKKPKISVKSNLILKGPDQVNMFHSQQKLAFKRLEDNERFGLGPVTFNNLITTQFMQLPPEPALSESPSEHIMQYPQETLLEDAVTTPVDDALNSSPQMFSFNQQLGVDPIPLLPPQQKAQSNDPSYIKLESTIKQNTQSPGLERMCNASTLLNSPALPHDYKASPPLEDVHKNMNEIKNEVKSDSFYNLALNSASNNPAVMDQYLLDNIISEQYAGHLDLTSNTSMQTLNDDQQNDVIEIDDNSDDTKLLPRFDMNFPLESLYLMHSDFHFLDNDIPSSNTMESQPEINRMVTEVPIINQNETIQESSNNDIPNCIAGKRDPILNTPVRPTTNKINVKNIELMKNTCCK